MATRKFSELRAVIAADPIRAERLRHATEVADQSYEAYQMKPVEKPMTGKTMAEVEQHVLEAARDGLLMMDARGWTVVGEENATGEASWCEQCGLIELAPAVGNEQSYAWRLTSKGKAKLEAGGSR